MHTAPIELKLEMPPPPQVVVNMVEPAAQAPAVHDPLTHVDPAVQGVPQPPQLLLSVCSLTQAPLQSMYPLLHVNVHALLTHRAVALATLVEHAFPHEPQSLALLVASTHVPPQSFGVATGQPETHVDFEHTGMLPLHAYAEPQPPQLLASVVKSTHAPLQSAVPLLQVKPHELLLQVAVALATEVEQAWPHVLQLSRSPVGSTQLPLQRRGAAVGHPDAHEYEAVAPTHTGVLPLRSLPQAPQLLEVVSRTQAPLQGMVPALHEKVQALPTQTATALALATLVVHA